MNSARRGQHITHRAQYQHDHDRRTGSVIFLRFVRGRDPEEVKCLTLVCGRLIGEGDRVMLVAGLLLDSADCT